MSSEVQARAETVLEAIRGRRNVPFQHVSDRPLCPDHLNLILEAANWAPTHKHTEPWRFVVFTGDGRRKFADALAQTYRKTCGEAFNQKKFDKAATRSVQVGAVIAVAVAFSGKVPRFEETLAVGAAVQNLQLAAHALGIGCSWSTPGYMSDPELTGFLGLDENMFSYGFLYLGYFESGAALLKSVRKPVDEKITRVDH